MEENPDTKINEEEYEILFDAFGSVGKMKDEYDNANTDQSIGNPFTIVGAGDLSSVNERGQRKNMNDLTMGDGSHAEFFKHNMQYVKLKGPKLSGRIDLSQFSRMGDDKGESMFTVGDVACVRVTGIQEYGAFAQILNGPSGLIPKKDISWEWVQNVADYVTVGDVFLAKITNIRDDGKIAFSRKEMLPNARTVQPGEVLSGIITQEKDFGFIVKFGEFTYLYDI